MSAAWVSLPRHWKLEDVQAVLNIIISLLSALGVYILARLCWQISAVKISRGSKVLLPSLLTLSSLGEVLDIVVLLGPNLALSRYAKILLQILVVTILTVAAILSGLIARYSTQRAEIVSTLNVSGLLTNRWHNSIGSANVDWNLTQTSLDQAGFPLDQFLDFLPDTSTAWQYKPDEWNNTWSMTCNYTNLTSIALNITNDGCETRYQQIPSLREILNPDDWADLYINSRGYYSDRRWKDALMFLYGAYYDDWDEVSTWEMTIAIAALHMHNFSMVEKNYTGDCQYGSGPVESASYTMASCHLKRPKDTPVDFNSARPDTGDVSNIPSAFNEYYQARFKRESVSDEEISIISPAELVRFLQTYIVVKDVQSKQPVSRDLSVRVRVVQLSTVFLVICILVALLIVVGLVIYATVLLILHKRDTHPPLSKLDWMLQSIEEQNYFHGTGPGRLKRSVTSNLGYGNLNLARQDRQRREFEEATYGDSQQHIIPPQQTTFDEKNLSWSSPASSPQIVYQGYHPTSSPTMSSKAPGLTVGVKEREPDTINQYSLHVGRVDDSPLRREY